MGESLASVMEMLVDGPSLVAGMSVDGVVFNRGKKVVVCVFHAGSCKVATDLLPLIIEHVPLASLDRNQAMNQPVAVLESNRILWLSQAFCDTLLISGHDFLGKRSDHLFNLLNHLPRTATDRLHGLFRRDDGVFISLCLEPVPLQRSMVLILQKELGLASPDSQHRVEQWMPIQVALWAKKKHFSDDTLQILIEHKIDGNHLLTLSRSDYEQMGITSEQRQDLMSNLIQIERAFRKALWKSQRPHLISASNDSSDEEPAVQEK